MTDITSRPIAGTSRPASDDASHCHDSAVRAITPALLEELYEQLPHGVVVQDAGGRIIAANGAACRALGLTPDELYGRVSLDPRWRAVDEQGRDLPGDEHPAMIALRTGQPVYDQVMGIQVPHQGATRWLRVTALPHAPGASRAPARVYAVFTDVTEEIEGERATRFIADAATRLMGSLDIDETLAGLTTLAVPFLADWCAIDVVEDGVIRRVAVHHQDPARTRLAHELQERYPARIDDTYGLGAALRTGAEQVIHDVPDELLAAMTRDAEHLRIARTLGLRAAAVLPLVARDRVLGALTLVMAESGRGFPPRTLDTARDLAQRAALALHNARMYSESRDEVERRRAAEAELLEANRELDARRMQLEEQAVELEMTNAQLQEQQIELEVTNQQLQEQQVELEAQSEELQVTTEQLAQHAEQLEQAQRATEQARRTLAGVLQQAPVAICVMRGPDLVYELANTRYHELLPGRGLPGREQPARELLGRRVTDAIPTLDPAMLAILRRVYETGEPYAAAELPIPRELDGLLQERWFNVVHHPLRDDAGVVDGLVTVATEVTELVRARRQAEEANAVKSQFLAAMSHELRTPLNAITGYVDLLAMGIRGAMSEAQQEDLARIRRSGDHLLRLINDILQFAKLEAGQLEFRLSDVPLDASLRELEVLVMPQMRAKRLSFGFSIGAEHPVARADRDKVQQIVLNLLSNAIKATEPGGSVRLEADVCHHTKSAIVRVHDSGVGIPPGKLATIFDPFVQVDRQLNRPGEGIGLGLAISRDLARTMGGELTVSSEVGRGSTFTLSLPLA